jgi:hypothetical protein
VEAHAVNVVTSDLAALIAECLLLRDDMLLIRELPGPESGRYGSARLIATEALERPLPKLCERIK